MMDNLNMKGVVGFFRIHYCDGRYELMSQLGVFKNINASILLYQRNSTTVPQCLISRHCHYCMCAEVSHIVRITESVEGSLYF